LQYVAVHPITSIITVILYNTGSLDMDSYSPAKAYVWLVAIEFASISVAMNCLVQFYLVVKEDLAPHKPIPKFMSVKLVVFFCWFQTIALQAMVSFGWIRDGWFGTAEETGEGIGYFIICMEMMLVSILHHTIFSVGEYAKEVKTNPLVGIRDAITGFDVIQDLRTVLQKHRKGMNPVKPSDPHEMEMQATTSPEASLPSPVDVTTDVRLSTPSKLVSRDHSKREEAALKPGRYGGGVYDQGDEDVDANDGGQFEIGFESDDSGGDGEGVGPRVGEFSNVRF